MGQRIWQNGDPSEDASVGTCRHDRASTAACSEFTSRIPTLSLKVKSSMRFLHTMFLVACVPTTLSAQQMIHESLTGTPWGHTTSGTWLNGIAESRSAFGKVDHLVTATSFSYSRSPLILESGTYIAVARFAKMVNTTGTAPINLSMIIPTSKTLVTDVSSQTLGSFIHTRALTFNLSAKSSVLFSLSNLDTTMSKDDYYFDDFYVGKVAEGPIELIESLGRRWSHSHGAPHYIKEVPDASSTFGFCDSLGPSQGNGLWWFDWVSGVKQFSAGLHTFNLRIKKVTSLAGYADFDIWISESTDGGATWQAGSKLQWDLTDHIVDKWVE